MHMKWKKVAVFGCVAMMTMYTVAGCGNDAGTADAAQGVAVAETTETAEAESGTVTVRVTAVEGDTVTGEIGTLSLQGAPDGEVPEEKPEGEASSGERPEGEAPSKEMSDGVPSGEMPDGEAPSGEKPDGADKGAPSGEMPDGADGEAPGEKPDGEAPEGVPSGEKPDGEAPGEKPDGVSGEKTEGIAGEATGEKPGEEAPSGEIPDGAPGGMPGGSSFESSGETLTFLLTDATEITVEYLQGSGEGTTGDIAVGSVLEVALDDENQAVSVVVRNLNAGGGFGGSAEVTNGTTANTVDADAAGETYTSSGDDENALRVDGATVTLSDITVEKTGGASSNTENGDFYGQNAGLLALNGAQVTITGATVSTSAVNGNGVFSYGEGTVVNISDSTIRTTERNSGGIQTTGGGTTNATNLDVETQGNSSAAIRSDRGGGTVNVEGGTYVTNGTGSPAVYCTADIAVTGAVLTANASEGVVVEGKNSVTLTDCVVTGAMDNTYNGDSDENIHCIMIYQSMSGDAAAGEAYFAAEGGSITSLSGDMFYVTNTDCEIWLKDVAFTLANDVFLRVEGNSSSRGWGTEGANGGGVTLTADAQQIEGNMLVDEISSLNFTMKNGTDFIGAINPDGEGGTVDVTLDADSAWTLTGDSYITSFDGAVENITANGYHLYVNGEQIV